MENLDAITALPSATMELFMLKSQIFSLCKQKLSKHEHKIVHMAELARNGKLWILEIHDQQNCAC
jgi:hypothetical protein